MGKKDWVLSEIANHKARMAEIAALIPPVEGYCYDPTVITEPKTFSLYAFAFPASFSLRTKTLAGASIPRRI
jgi:hypothetical protein